MRQEVTIATLPEEPEPITLSLPKPKKSIWAVGGGKGGTGKSFIATSLGIELASSEGDVVMIDADLGGPNLHTFLAVRDSGRDLGDFVTNKVGQLEEILMATCLPGLKLIKGSDNFLFLANLKHFKKLKLIRQIKALDAKRVIIDVGTGSSYNSLDFFILSHPGILVVTPEPTAVENAHLFLKSCIVRILKLYIEYYKIHDLVKKISAHVEGNLHSIRSFLASIISYDKSYAHILIKALKNFKPCLIVNKARNDRDILLGQSIAEVARKYLLVELNFLGAVPYDERVHLSVQKFTPYILEYPDSSLSRSVSLIAEKLKVLEQSS